MTMHEKAVVPLVTGKTYADRANDLYSGIVITCIVVQVLFFFAVTSYWSGALRLVRWYEKDKEMEWAHESDMEVIWTRQSLLLFWNYEEELEKQEDARRELEADSQLNRRPTFIGIIVSNSVSGMLRRKSASSGSNIATRAWLDDFRTQPQTLAVASQ